MKSHSITCPQNECTAYVQVIIKFVKINPRLDCIGEIEGSASYEWNSESGALLQLRSPLAIRIELLNKAIGSAMDKLLPRLEWIEGDLPHCEPLAAALVQAGAYSHAQKRLLLLLKNSASTDEERAENLFALGICSEGKGRIFFDEARSYYTVALGLTNDNVKYSRAIARLGRE